VTAASRLGVFTHTDCSRWGRFFSDICMYVYLHNISKTDAAGITELDVEMFHDDSWKPIYFRVRGQGHESQKNIAGKDFCTLASAGCF